MSAYRMVLIAHLLGLAFGMGGATTIDAMLLIASRRRSVSRDFIEIVHAAAGLVAGAMVLLAVSGTAFFALGAEPSPKFWAKLIIVGIACLNGLAAHRLVFPLIEKASASGAGRLRFRPWPARLAAASAATSGVSWTSALVLGAWRDCPFGMGALLAAYGAILTGAVLVSSLLVAPRVFVIAPTRRTRTSLSKALRRRIEAAGNALALAVAGGALQIADEALAVAARLDSPARWSEREPHAAPAYAAFSELLSADGTGRWPRQGHGAASDPYLSGESFGSDARFWPNPRD